MAFLFWNATSKFFRSGVPHLPYAMLLDYDRCVTVCCVQCGKPLNKCRGRSARYCEPKCRAAQYRLRDLLNTLPASITTLYQRLREHAPEEARAYRLVRAQPDGIWQYPRSDGKPWRAFAGRSYRTAFRLWPFGSRRWTASPSTACCCWGGTASSPGPRPSSTASRSIRLGTSQRGTHPDDRHRPQSPAPKRSS